MTLAALILGAIFGYFLNKRYDAIQASSSARLNEIQLEIANIDKNYRKTISEAIINEKGQNLLESSAITHLNEIKASIKEIEKSYKKSILDTEISKNNTELTLNISDFISDIQPNVEINLQPKSSIRNFEKNTFTLVWEITNIGKHTVIINNPTILLSLKVIEDDAKDNILIEEGKDYELLSKISIGELPPGQKTLHNWDIKLNHNFKYDRIYHYSKFSCQIHPSVKTIALTFLINHLSKKQINDLTDRSFGRRGWITFNKN